MRGTKYLKKKKLGSYPYASVILSITLALFIIGFFGLFIIHANRLTQIIQENVEIQVYLNNYVTDNEIIHINKALSSKDYIVEKDGKLQILFISKEKASEELIAQTGEDFTKFLGENPLRDAFTMKIKSEYHTLESIAEICSDVEKVEGVFEVTYLESLIESIRNNTARIVIILLAFAVILLMVVIALINNAIKLALFSQRFLIRSMQLVGAKDSFIQRPFIYRSGIYGMMSGLIAGASLLAFLRFANARISNLSALQRIEEIAILLAAVLLLGIVIASISTKMSINKYLKMSLDNLY